MNETKTTMMDPTGASVPARFVPAIDKERDRLVKRLTKEARKLSAALAAATKQTRAFLGQKLAEINSAAHGRNEQALADMEHNAQVLGDAQQAVAVVHGAQGGVLAPTAIATDLNTAMQARDTAHRQRKAAATVDKIALLNAK